MYTIHQQMIFVFDTDLEENRISTVLCHDTIQAQWANSCDFHLALPRTIHYKRNWHTTHYCPIAWVDSSVLASYDIARGQYAISNTASLCCLPSHMTTWPHPLQNGTNSTHDKYNQNSLAHQSFRQSSYTSGQQCRCATQHTHTTGKHLATTVLLGSLHINAMCFSHVQHVLAICYLWS